MKNIKWKKMFQRLPSMQMEKAGWSNSLENWEKRIKNALRKQILKELLKKEPPKEEKE